MDRRVLVLFVAGVGLLLIAVNRGGLSAGYRPGMGAILLRIGVVYLALSVATVLLRPLTVRDGIQSVVVAALAVFAVGAVVMYADLGVTSPEYGTPLTTGALVGTQVEAVGLTLPVSIGYLAGVYVRQNNTQRAKEILLLGFIVGWLGSAVVVGVRGQFNGIYNAVLLLTTVGSFVFGLLPLVVIGWMGAGTEGHDSSSFKTEL